jgi:glucose/arabinose dehydrogenase
LGTTTGTLWVAVKHRDERATPPRPDLVAKAIKPDYALGPHTASLGLLTGFITDDGDAMGRPVGVAIDAEGALLVADDVGNAVWRVARAQGS